MEIAVIIVNYRSAALTLESVRAIERERASAAFRIRVVIVDNASGDFPALGEAMQANGWVSWVTLLQAPINGGFAYGNNFGVQRAFADGVPDYVYLINPDAQVRPDAIGSLVRFLEAHPRAGIAGSQIENVDGTEWPIAFRFPGLMSELDQGLTLGIVSRLLRPWKVARLMGDAAEPVDWVSGASMLIRPAVFAAIGGMDENYFLYFEETDFCYRARRAGFATWYVPESRVAHLKGQSTGLTRKPARPARLPGYWFESRRRYFVRTFGIHHAMAIDALAVMAHGLGLVKRALQGRARTAVPHFVRDLLRHSVLRAANRGIPPVRSPTFPLPAAAPGGPAPRAAKLGQGG